MRTIITKVYGYDELSAEAKEAAFNEWQSNASQHYYAWGPENEDILKAIYAATGVSLSDWQYDDYNYHYSLNDIEKITHPEGYYAFDGNMDELCGVRAAKVALALYYQLTEQRTIYGFYSSNDRKAKSTSNYSSIFRKTRRSAFMTVNPCFTGYCLSNTFADALWESIAKNGHSDAYGVTDHLKAAFDKLFQAFVDDRAHEQTLEYFTNGPAYEVEYLESGEIYQYCDNAA